jgi:hypothetical protein
MGAEMDPITLIVTALAAGAALGLKDAASSAVKDAYASLKALLQKRLAGRPAGKQLLAGHQEDPARWEAPLAAELEAAGADADPELVAVAQTLLSLAEKEGFRSAKYTVDISGSYGVQVGDHTVQHNTFRAPDDS